MASEAEDYGKCDVLEVGRNLPMEGGRTWGEAGLGNMHTRAVSTRLAAGGWAVPDLKGVRNEVLKWGSFMWAMPEQGKEAEANSAHQMGEPFSPSSRCKYYKLL